MKVLIVEDEPAIRETIAGYLQKEGFVCEQAEDYDSADEKVALYEYDLVVLDITLPGGSGLDVLRSLKKIHPETGVLIVSAKNSLDDKITGLDLGADDYITKPFHLSELNARVKALLRRRFFKGSNSIVFEELEIDPAANILLIHGQPVELTKKEYDLLLYFIANKNRVLTKAEYWIAADVNYSKSITTSDLVLIRKAILQITTSFELGSWVFVPEYYLSEQFDFSVDYVNNPFSAVWDNGNGETRVYKPSPYGKSYLNSFDINLLNPDVLDEATWQVRAIKLGDVNGSASPLGLAEPPSGSPVVLTIEKTIDGSQAKFDFRVEGFVDIVGYQMEIEFDTSTLDYIDALEKDLLGVSSDFFAEGISEGVIRSLWYDEVGAQAQTLSDSSSLFQLVFNGSGNFTDSNVQLSIEQMRGARMNSNFTPNFSSVAFDRTGGVHPIIEKGVFENGILSLNVTPNPFREQVVLNVKMVHDDFVEIKVLTVLGQQILSSKIYVKRGQNIIDLTSLADLPKGVLLVSVVNNGKAFSTRLIKQ